MALTRRYSPPWSPLDVNVVCCDFSSILPPGVGIAFPGQDFSQINPLSPTAENVILPTPRFEVWTNTVPPIPAPEDWYVDPRLAPVTPWGIFDPTPAPGNYGVWFWVLNETTNEAEWAQFDYGQTPATEGANVGGVGIGWIALGTAVRGRTVYSVVSGGDPGTDYQFRWVINDSLGNRWTRTGLVFCSETS
jgi:hypothetical protein